LFMKQFFQLVLSLAFLVTLSACVGEQQKLADMEEYTGPIFESTDVEVYMSDSTVLKLILRGKKQIQQQNGDIEFPEGFRITFFDKNENTTTEITALQGYKKADQNVYQAIGDVLVRDLIENKTLSSEEMYWDPTKEIIYTDKFVTIETEEQLVLAEGMKAPQDFSTYELINVRDSEIILKDNEEFR